MSKKNVTVKNSSFSKLLEETVEKVAGKGKTNYPRLMEALRKSVDMSAISQGLAFLKKSGMHFHIHEPSGGETSQPKAQAQTGEEIPVGDLMHYKDMVMTALCNDAWKNDPDDPPAPRLEPDMGGGESFFVTACYQEGLQTKKQLYINMANMLVEREVTAVEELVKLVAVELYNQLQEVEDEDGLNKIEEAIENQMLGYFLTPGNAETVENMDQVFELFVEVVINSPMLLDGYRYYSGDVSLTRAKCLLYFRVLGKIAGIAALLALDSIAEAVGMSPLTVIGTVAEEAFNLAGERNNRFYRVLGEAVLNQAEPFFNGEYYSNDGERISAYELGLMLKAMASAYQLTGDSFYMNRARSNFNALEQKLWRESGEESGEEIVMGAYTYPGNYNAVVFSHLNVAYHALAHWAKLDDGQKENYLDKLNKIFQFDVRNLLNMEKQLFMHDCAFDGSYMSGSWCQCCNAYLVEIINAYLEVMDKD